MNITTKIKLGVAAIGLAALLGGCEERKEPVELETITDVQIIENEGNDRINGTDSPELLSELITSRREKDSELEERITKRPIESLSNRLNLLLTDYDQIAVFLGEKRYFRSSIIEEKIRDDYIMIERVKLKIRLGAERYKDFCTLHEFRRILSIFCERENLFDISRDDYLLIQQAIESGIKNSISYEYGVKSYINPLRDLFFDSSRISSSPFKPSIDLSMEIESKKGLEIIARKLEKDRPDFAFVLYDLTESASNNKLRELAIDYFNRMYSRGYIFPYQKINRFPDKRFETIPTIEDVLRYDGGHSYKERIFNNMITASILLKRTGIKVSENQLIARIYGVIQSASELENGIEPNGDLLVMVAGKIEDTNNKVLLYKMALESYESAGNKRKLIQLGHILEKEKDYGDHFLVNSGRIRALAIMAYLAGQDIKSAERTFANLSKVILHSTVYKPHLVGGIYVHEININFSLEDYFIKYSPGKLKDFYIKRGDVQIEKLNRINRGGSNRHRSTNDYTEFRYNNYLAEAILSYKIAGAHDKLNELLTK